MPERSFFVNGYQMPVCARCTGVIVASLTAFIMFFLHRISLILSGVLCCVMFSDWFIQHIGAKESTNLRRFVTGMMGGYGFMTLQMYVYRGAFLFIKDMLEFII